MVRVSARASAIPAFQVMDLVAAAREREATVASGGPSVCHLEVGQPSTPPPGPVIDAARAALDLGSPLSYTDSLGLPELRERISRWYRERHGIDVPPERIALSSGASAGCVLTFLAAFDEGDRVAVIEPGYPCYAHQLRAFGVEVVPVQVGPEDGFVPTPDAMERATAGGALAGVISASPSNPTGAVLEPRDLDALHGWCRERGALLVSDEIYDGIVEDGPAPTAAALDDAVVLQSFSKYFCMTGWRLGWLVLPEELVRPVERLAQNLYLAPPTLSQHAALASFDATEELDSHVARYATNRHLLVDTLRAAGVEVAPARGAFYVWADLGPVLDRVVRTGSGAADGVAAGSVALCRLWLDELAVAATPGTDFDPQRGDRFVRFSVAGSTEEVAEAARRLGDWLAAL